jgi:hypothetical protein
MAELNKPARGDDLGRCVYRATRLQARLTRLETTMVRAKANGNDKLLTQFQEEKEMRTAELNFLTLRIKKLEQASNKASD